MVSRRIADEVVLVPVSRKVGEIDRLYALNEVAARIWDLIAGRATISVAARSAKVSTRPCRTFPVLRAGPRGRRRC